MASPRGGADWELHVPPELEEGVYASFLTTWHTANEFTLDFATFVPDTLPLPLDPSPDDAHLEGVSRVKVPPAEVFAMIRKIHANMTLYEETYGSIHYPERRKENE